MEDSDKPKLLDHELAQKNELFFRYFHIYNKTYHETSWQLEEVRLLLKVRQHSNHNMWMLNEALYRYTESSISALNWLQPEVKERPFVHKFLREWRNENHHQGKYDFYLCDFIFHIGEDRHELMDDYFIFPMTTLSKRLKKLIAEQFGTEKIATNATVHGMVATHHAYMASVFHQYEQQLQSEMPKKYLVHNSQSKRSLGGGKYEQYFPEIDFWRHA